MGVSIPDRRLGLRANVTQLPVDLRLHVEWLLAAGDPALVAGYHELANLVSQPRVDALRAQQLGHLGIDVERWLPARLAPGRLGLHELAAPSPRFRAGRGRAETRPRPRLGAAV